MKSRIPYLIVTALFLLVLFFPFNIFFPPPGEEYGIIIEKFRNPDLDARPMARMWFTDAGAGASEEGLALIEKHIKSMAAGGFGGVEIAYLSDGSAYTNQEARAIGWGTENWRKILKQALKTANAVEGGFKVDISITAHRPPSINTIDPNDDEAAKEASYAYKKITLQDISADTIELPLPVRKTEDYFRPVGGSGGPAPFLFTDNFVAATVARVSGFDGSGIPVFEFSSLQDVTASTWKKVGKTGKVENDTTYAGYAAGIPDRAFCAENHIDYTKILSSFGPEQKEPGSGKKIDAEFNRKRMADWQYIYETDLSSVKGLTASESEKLEIGDWVIFGSYYRGTGQVVSGGGSVVMYNRCYATDYFSDIAVQKIFDYYSQYIFDDELLALMKENGEKNGTSIFEDSIEIHKSGPAWVYDFFSEFLKYNDYNGTRFAPVLAMGSAANFDDPAEAERTIEDYNLVMGYLYATEHAARISTWAKSFNYTYRSQAYPLPGLDVDAAAIAVDIPEGDNSTVGDGVRQLASVVYMKGEKMLSMESTTFISNVFSEWVDVIKELNAGFSQGVSRSILHGTPYARNFSGYLSDGPGWNFFKPNLNGGGFSAWNYRQIYFGDIHTFSNYVSRLQSIVQNGQAKVDLAVLLDTKTGYSNQSGNSMQFLLDRGFSYSILSEPVLHLEKAYAIEGILAPDGPSYKALIVKDASVVTTSLLEEILEYARNGLPVILYNSAIERIYGTNKEADNDETMKGILNLLLENEHVFSANGEGELLGILEQAGITPAASHNQPGLEITHRETGKGIYYYLYNGKGVKLTGMPFGGIPGEFGPQPEPGVRPGITSGAPVGGTGYGNPEPSRNLFGTPPGGPGGMRGRNEGIKSLGGRAVAVEEPEMDNHIETTVSLEGKGIPYALDMWTGEIKPVARYTAQKGKITLDITLDGRESMVILIASDTTGLPAVKRYVTRLTGGEAVIDSGKLVFRAAENGTYSVTYDDQTTRTIQVTGVPEPILINKGWDLRLESWGPAEKGALLSQENQYGYEVDPSVSDKTTIELNRINLCTWNDLPVSKSQLDTLGVAYMDDVSGTGYYKTTFELPAAWTDTTGACLQMGHHSDMITEVTINGDSIVDINQFSNTVDIGNYLKKGTNDLAIKLVTTLENRASASGRSFYGLTEVKLVPYIEVKL